MKIAVIFTGGTIGSKIAEDGYISVDTKIYKLIEMYWEKVDVRMDFITREPYSILSENLNFEHIDMLVECVRELLEEGEVEGILITHGTDTLQYSAAILSHFFGKARVPIILVSSAYVLEDPRSNGFDNFVKAVDYITNVSPYYDFESEYDSRVMVSYKNSDGKHRFIGGNRLDNPRPFTGDLYEVTSPIKPVKVYDSIRKLAPVSGSVLRIQACPGMLYPDLDSSSYDQVKTVMLETYHSGTLCIDNALRNFIDKAEKRNISVHLTGLASGTAEYETVKAYDELGIIVDYDEAPISCYCRLVIECAE